MTTNRTLISICAALLIGVTTVGAQPPVAPVRPVREVFYGVSVTDDYRYMENLQDPEVQTWIKAQADYAEGVLKSIPGRDGLLTRLKELDSGSPFRISSFTRRPEGTLYYLKMLASENVSKLYVRKGLDGQEKLLVNPELRNASTAEHHTLQFYTPSSDGQYILYGISKAGNEETTLYILDVATGHDLPDSINRLESWYCTPEWLPGDRSFVYSRLQLTTAETPRTELYNNSRTYRHLLGDNPEKDQLLLGAGLFPQVPIAVTDFPSVWVTPGSDYCLAKITHGDQNEISLYSAPLNSLGKPGMAWTRICDVSDSVSEFCVRKNDVYMITAWGAPRFKVVRSSLAKPDFAQAATVLPPGTSVINSLSPAEDALYIGVADAGYNRIICVDYKSLKAEALSLPNKGSGMVVASDPEVRGIFTTTTTWTSRGGIYEYNCAKKTFTDTNLRPRGKYDDVPGYESEEVMVKSWDGTMVPLSILHKVGLVLDGSHPTLISGYGAYGLSSNVGFDPIRLAWLERGGVYAIAHVRGGGAYGNEWHLAGQKLTKPNTWKDFIACAQYLIDRKYTTPSHLAGQGGSAGGILIGRALTERPDLFAAAVINVGCTDAIRMETTPNGVPNIPEFGSTKTEEGFRGLLEMSALQHVKDGVAYPAVLLAHGINDPRVDPWMSAKMTARLQAATSSGKPVLFRVNYDAGHGIGSTKAQTQEERADTWAFLLWQFGEKDFQK
jgi:prolyl oligopeptidase